MIAALLLAAGGARRYGADKLMAPLADGTPLALAALLTLKAEVEEIVAVVRPDTPVAALLSRQGVRLVCPPGEAHGIGQSVARGITSLMEQAPSPTGCIIAFSDMPLVRADTIARLAAALRRGASIVAPHYRGTRGHPVGFAASWFPSLARLAGENALRELLAVHRHAIERLPVDDPGILADVDRPSDLEVLLADS